MSDKKFIDGYNDLMGHIYEVMDDTIHTIADAMDIAKEKTSELGGLTQEEINHIADALMRDVEQAADHDDSLNEWFKFDVSLLENFALDAFQSLADKTRLELAKIDKQAKKYHSYQSGDITGPGTFNCDKCDKQISFKSTSTIPHCPDCQSNIFTRH